MSFLSVFLRYQLVFLGVVAGWLAVAAGFHYGAGCSFGNALMNAVAVVAVPAGYLLDRTGKGGAVFAPAMCSGVLFWLSFFPANLGPLMYVALVPFLSLIRAEGVGTKRRYCAAWLGGLVFGFLAIKWIRVAHPMMALFAWPGLALWCSVFWPMALYLLRLMDRFKLPYALSLPLVWVALEYFRDHFPTAYPFMKAFGMFQFTGFGWYALAFGFFGLVLGYGTYRLIHPPFDVGPRVAAIQESIPQNEKMGDHEGLFFKHDELCRKAALAFNQPDLILWPETCYPFADVTFADPKFRDTVNDDLLDAVFLEEGVGPAVAGRMRDAARAKAAKQTVEQQAATAAFIELAELGRAKYAAKHWKTNVLLGLSGVEHDGETTRKFNSARLIRADGSTGPRYDKMHLVPFGEYLPFRETFPFMLNFSPYPDKSYSNTPGERFQRFQFNTLRQPFRSGKELAPDGKFTEPKELTYTFGVLICYEDTDPHLARRYNQLSGDPDPADFLVNISNDGWFDGSEQHELHVAICRFRAVEARRSIVRAVNMGISCIIDPDGRISDWADEPWDGSKKKRAILSGGVKLDTRGSPFAYLGDWVPAICWAAVLGAIVAAWVRRKRVGS